MDIVEVMRDRENICNYLDIPLQHGSTRMLKIMRRGITREKTDDLIKNIRDINPDITIRTTLIAGHPGETDHDFEEMYEFVERSRFDRLGIFTYSHEEGTTSHKLEDDVPEQLKDLGQIRLWLFNKKFLLKKIRIKLIRSKSFN